MTRIAEPEPFLVRHRMALLGILGLLLYLPFLGLRDFWYADEPDIAEVCRTMFFSGDWIAPRRLGVIWVDYPPMIYWAGAAASHLLGGISEFALRLPNALASIGMVLLSPPPSAVNSHTTSGMSAVATVPVRPSAQTNIATPPPIRIVFMVDMCLFSSCELSARDKSVIGL